MKSCTLSMNRSPPSKWLWMDVSLSTPDGHVTPDGWPQLSIRPDSATARSWGTWLRYAETGQPGRVGAAETGQPGRVGAAETGQPRRIGAAETGRPGRIGAAETGQPRRIGAAASHYA